MIVNEHLLFVAHEGSVGSQRAAIIMHNHCLPIAVSHSSEQRDDGIMACWESSCDVEEFFAAINIVNVCRGMDDTDPLVSGLFVYAVQYVVPMHGPTRPIDMSNEDRDEDDPENDDGWEHLRGGEIRRPSGVELLRLAQGEPPWDGGVVL